MDKKFDRTLEKMFFGDTGIKKIYKIPLLRKDVASLRL